MGRKPQESVSKALRSPRSGRQPWGCRPFHGLDGAPNLTQGFAFGSTLGFMLSPASRAWKNTNYLVSRVLNFNTRPKVVVDFLGGRAFRLLAVQPLRPFIMN